MSESIFDVAYPHRPKRHAGGPPGPSYRGATQDIREAVSNERPLAAKADDFESIYATDEDLHAAACRVSKFETRRARAFALSTPAPLDASNPTDEWNQPGTRRIPKPKTNATRRFSRN